MKYFEYDFDNSRSPAQEITTIVVGKPEKQFIVHTSLLTHYSTIFGATDDTGLQHNIQTLAQEDPQIFEFFIHWVYHQRFPSQSRDCDELVDAWSKDRSDDAEDKGDTKSSNLVALHIFAHKYGILQLQKDTLDEYFRHFQKDDTSLPPIDAIKNAFVNLDSRAPLCRLLVDIQCCCKQHENWTQETAEWYPSAFLLGTLRRYAAIVQDGKQKRWWKLDLCDYHNHEHQEERAACKKAQKYRKRQARLAARAATP